MNTFDWLSDITPPLHEGFDLVEVSFKRGSRKAFYHNPTHTMAVRGDLVVVECKRGYDIGEITLTGELVKLQLRKKKKRPDDHFASVIRRANERDQERLIEARGRERDTLIQARAIARTLSLEMKIGDVEYQGDGRKATFFYTADGRVDFRELIRRYAQEFRIKVEMRQIGARQESARIGGLGSCGRELCCATWLSDFKTVNTSAARYQNLAINQAKLSGQCGRLKCCLNYELDTYIEELKAFPTKADRLRVKTGQAHLVKKDIFKRILYYSYKDDNGRYRVVPLSIAQVVEIQALNKAGKPGADLGAISAQPAAVATEADFAEDLTGVIELPTEKRKRKRSRRKGRQKP